MIVIPDFNLDLPRLGMVKSVPERLSGNPVDFVAQNGMEIARLTFHGDAKCRSCVVGWISGQFLTSEFTARARSFVSTVEARNPCTASRPSVIALAARSMLLSSCSFASTGRSGSNCGNNLEAQQQTMEALKQCVMKFARDACPLSDTRLQRHLELMMQLP